MKNILSYEFGHTFTGKEIIEWCEYQIKTKSSRKKKARRLYSRYYNLNPNKIYKLECISYVTHVNTNNIEKEGKK